MNSQNKRESLMTLFRILIAGDATVKDSIAKTLGSVIVKTVELQYSGTGKIIHGQGKRNFSATNTYLCLRDALIEKYGEKIDVKKLPGQVGMWLSRAGDREGGRKQREKNRSPIAVPIMGAIIAPILVTWEPVLGQNRT
ncbi:PREDICTED: uncharacterized protein LOC105571012, partial [Vollenhovia emeryi]|uniref:uncharacterized protein LOC105571012 n=1 Tax=Vollenhovia emeryi TaxID=411798 RepID=UPI0005F37BEE